MAQHVQEANMAFYVSSPDTRATKLILDCLVDPLKCRVRDCEKRLVMNINVIPLDAVLPHKPSPGTVLVYGIVLKDPPGLQVKVLLSFQLHEVIDPH